MMQEPTKKPWTPESMAAHKARLEIIEKLGYGPTSLAGPDWIVHRVKKDLAALQAKLDAANLQIHDAMEIIQDHCDLLSEQPVDSKRPFIIGARARLAAFIEKYKIKTGPEQYTDKRVRPTEDCGCLVEGQHRTDCPMFKRIPVDQCDPPDQE